MTELYYDDPEPGVDELTTDELDTVSGGRIKLPWPQAYKDWLIANLQRDNPGF
jgi:bacteriocin-like protein